MLSEYLQLVLEADQANEEADNFDLRSESAESVHRFLELEEEAMKANEQLVRFVQHNGDAILDEMAASLAEFKKKVMETRRGIEPP